MYVCIYYSKTKNKNYKKKKKTAKNNVLVISIKLFLYSSDSNPALIGVSVSSPFAVQQYLIEGVRGTEITKVL